MNDLFELPLNEIIPDPLAGGPLADEPFRLDDLLVMPDHPDVSTISRQLEDLTIDNNTQSLQLKIERMKRRQLRSSLRSVEQVLLRPCADATSLKHDLIASQEQQNAINYQFDADVTSLRTLMFRCFTRMHQMMAKFLPHIRLPPDDDFELQQMLQEITQTFQQFHSYYSASYV